VTLLPEVSVEEGIDTPNSPHLQAANAQAQLLIALAENDDMRAPNGKNMLRETFAKADPPSMSGFQPSRHQGGAP
jgi:carboxymethylenebutenolidase